VFLNLLDDFTAAERWVSSSRNAGNCAPRAFAEVPRDQRNDYRKADFANAMETLFADGAIENVDYGRRSDARHRLARRVK
jgi:hypothetical protein